MKLIAIDMDGTLLDSANNISKRQTAFLEALSTNEEYTIVITTGRPLPGVKNLISKELFKNVYIIGSNGGFIYSPNGEKLINQKIFDIIDITQIANLGLKNNVGLVLSDISNYYAVADKSNDIIEYDASINKLETTYLDKKTAINIKDISRIVYFIEPDVQFKIFNTIPSSFFKKYNIIPSQPYLIDFLPKSTDKYIALKILANYLNIDLDNIIAIGDGENDITMMTGAGVSIAMNNAVVQVKENADYITKSNDQDGVKYALENYILK